MIIHDKMHEVRISGWREGARKISGTEAIRSHKEMGLADAKGVIDRCLDGETTIIQFDSPEPAISLAKAMDEVGFIVEALKSNSGETVWTSRAAEQVSRADPDKLRSAD